MANGLPTKGQIIDGFRYLGGDPNDSNSWEADSGLKPGAIADGYRFLGGDPNTEQSWQPVALEEGTRGAFDVVNDTVIEAANAVLGGVGAIADFVSPGNRLSQGTESLIREGEQSQSDIVRARKQAFRSELEGAEGFADEAGVAARYALENPGLIAAQAAGSYAVPGAAIKGVGTGARTLGLGQKATTRAQLGTGVVVGGAMAGGDAGGQAYDLVMQIPDDVLSQSPEYQSLLEGGMEPQAAREKLATDAARMASAVPAAIGAAGGAIGVERLLSGGKGFAGGVLSRGAKTGGVEALTEGFEEGVTGYSGRAAAAKLDPSIDPMKGVGGEAVIGAVTGFVPGAVIGGADAAMEPSRQRQLQAEQALRNAPDAATAAAAANELAGSVTELEAAVDQYLTPGGAIPSPAQAVAEQPTRPREDPTRSMIDRQASLISEAQAAGTQFDRQMALDQAQAALPQPQEGRAAGFVDLTPMNEMQAQQRLAVLRDQTAQAGGNALGLAIVPHPAQADRFAIAEQALPDLSLPQTTPTITPDQAQFQIESAALGGQVSQARAEDSASRGPVIDQALKNVEERGGVASPAEARIFQEAGLGQPYDSVDSTLGTAEQPLIETAGAARESFTPNQQIADQEIQADQAARRESDIAQRDRTTEQQIAAAGQARQAPDAGTVISALVTPGAQRSAEQVRTINEARNRFSPADFSILERAATAPFQLNTEERMRLRELRNPSVTETSTNVPETGTGLTGTRVAERLGQPSGGRIVTTNAKLSTQRVAPGGTVSINDGNTQHEARIVDPSRVGIPGRLLKQIARIFNKRLVVFESDTLQADGFVMDGDNDSIYINVNSSISPLAVFGHELTHLLKRENPEAYAALEAVVQQEMRDGSMAEYEQEVGDGANLEEMTSDLVGNRFQEADFWQSVFDEIAAQNPEGARGIIARVTAAINRAINAFLKVVRQPGFQADQYVNDISAVKRAVNQAMAAYMQRPATEQATPEVISGAQNVTPEITEQNRPSMAERLREAARAARTEMGETITASKARRGGVVEQAGDFTIRTQKDGTLGVTGEPEAIRELLPEGVAGRVVPGGMVFTATVAPRVRAALEGRKLGYSRAGQVTEKLPMKDGKYVGAPEKFNTPGKIPQLRKWLKTLAVEGEAGRYWYENSSREVLAMVGGNVTEARKFVALLSIYSPQAKVDANSTFALRAWAQYKAGQPISVKTGVQDRKAQEALDDVDAFWSGEKTGNFFFNLLREIDPSTAGRQGATIDMWMMRAGQYSNDAPTATQYAFMENETNRLAQELGWEPQQVQAAIWVAMKARMENAGVKKRTEASSEKNGWIRYEYPLKNGKPRKTRVIIDAQKHRDNWLKHSFEHDPTKDDTQQAKFDFSDGLRRHVGQLSWEARPGRSTNVLPGVNDAPYEQQVEFQQAVQKALLDDNGIDLLAYKLGMLVDGPDILAPGVWQGEIAAGMQKLVALAPAKGDEGKTSIDPAQKKAIETYAATLGLLLRQEGVGYHRPFYSGSLRNSNGVDLNIGRTLSPSEAQSLWAAINERMIDAGVANWEKNAGLISSPTGMRIVNFGAIADNESFRKLVKDAAETLVVDEIELGVFASDGDLISNDWRENPNGEDYRQRIAAAGSPDLLEWAGAVLAPRVQSVFNEFSSRYGWGDPGRIEDLFDQPAAETGANQEVTSTDPSAGDQNLQFSRRRKPAPKKTVKAYKLFRVDARKPGQLFPLFVNANDPVDIGVWLDADEGPLTEKGKVKSKIGELAYRPGWHAGDVPIATHIGGKSDPSLTAPDVRPENHVWAEVEMAADRDWQKEANKRGTNAQGKLIAGKAHITDQIPVDGYYRYKTNPNMTGNWLIGGSMKVNRILSDTEVERINRKAGVEDLPREAPFDAKKYGFKASRQRNPQVDTAEFKRWFGDSVVVDENGDPLVVYHGTKYEFSEFATKMNELGSHFGTTNQANSFAENKTKLGKDRVAVKGGRVMPVYLSIKNPLRLQDQGRFDPETVGAQLVDMGIMPAETFEALNYIEREEALLKLQDAIKAAGYDGVVYLNRREGFDPFGPDGVDGETLDNMTDEEVMDAFPEAQDSWIVFEPEQIKSATGNQGTFDPTNPDIRFSRQRTSPFYSQLAEAIDQVPERLATQPAAQWKAWLASNASKLGIKKDEIEWTGINDYLDLRGKDKVSKAEIADYLNANGIQVQDVMFRSDAEAPIEETDVTYYYDSEDMGTPNGDSASSIREFSFMEDGKRTTLTAYELYDPYEDRGWEVYEGSNRAFKTWDLSGVREYVRDYVREYAPTAAPDVTRFDEFQLPGGENYKELMLQLPDEVAKSRGISDYRVPQLHRYGKREADYNRLAHVRFNDRVDADGNKVLFIEEIQSDWAQEGRKKGFAKESPKYLKGKASPGAGTSGLWQVEWEDGTISSGLYKARAEELASEGKLVRPSGVSKAPFISDTKAWVALTVKRMLAYAAENGYDKVAFIDGQQSADRYDLSKVVDSIDWELADKQTKAAREIRLDLKDSYLYLQADDSGVVTDVPLGSNADKNKYVGKKIDDVVGKELAKKIQEKTSGKLSGEGLKLGGEGMIKFYDQILPQVVNDVLKKLGGGKLEQVDIKGRERGGISGNSIMQEMGIPEAQRAEYWGNLTDKERDDLTENARNVSLVQPGFTVTDAMREKVAGGLPLFSRKRNYGTLTAAQEQALRNVGGIVPEQTVAQRAKELGEKFKRSWFSGIFDQFAPLKDVDQRAYMLARLSKGSDGALEALMLYGKPFMNGDVPDVNVNDQGFINVMATLKGEHDRFLWWVAAQRAENLKAQGRENLFTDQDISSLKSLNQGNFDDGTPRAQAYASALVKMNEFNDAVLNIAEQSGLIDGQARQLFKDMPYVPFYRVMEGGVEGPSFSSGLVNQRAWKKLKGGTQKLNEDLLSNVLLNWSHLFDAAGKNRAAVASMQAATQIGIAQEVPAGTKGAVKVMEQGQTKHYVIDDPYVMEAVTALNYQPPGFFQPFSTVKKWLTIGVTASPTFKIKNLMRDSLQAIGTAPMSYNVASNVMRGFKQGSQETQTFASMLAGGGLIRFGSMLEGTSRTQYMIERQGGILLNEGGWKKLQRQMTGLVEAYAELGDRLENVNRVSLYEHLVSKGYSQAEANFMSRDLMDFSLQGRWPVVRFLAQSVPFLNARLQGLSKLGRGAKDDTRRFGYVVGAVALASIALMLAYEDDEDWKKRPDWDRDSNWWFKIGDTAFRIPKPFEIGAIGTVAERTWEVAFNDEMSWKRYRQRLSHMIFETFAMDPTPQLVVPISEIYANKEGFTQRPIEGLGLQKLRPEDRATERTSSVARLLGQMGLPSPVSLVKGDYEKLSPVQIDHLVRGYFGWIGSTATTILDFGLRPLMDRGERPAYRLKDVFVAGNFAEGLPANSSRYVDQLYEQARIIEQAYMSYQDAKKKGDRERMRELVAEDGNKIKAYKSINKISRQVSEINRKIRQIESSKTLSADTKRKMIDQLSERKNQVAKKAQKFAKID